MQNKGYLLNHLLNLIDYLSIHLVDCGHKDAVELVHVIWASNHHVVHVQVRDHVLQRPESKFFGSL